MNSVSKHSHNHAESAYASYVGTDHKGAEFIGNKFTHKHTLSLSLSVLTAIFQVNLG